MYSTGHRAVLGALSPLAGIGADQLSEFLPDLVRAAWFSAAFLVVVLVGLYVVEPALTRVVRSRNRNNPTIEEAISRYFQLLVLVVGVYVAAGLAGYGRFLTNSAIVIAAATLAIGVAGQEVIGSLVSGVVLVLDPEFNIGDYIEWADGEGTVRSITLRVTRVQTQNGEFVTVPNEVLTKQAVSRPFAHGRYRVDERIGIAYEDDVGAAIDQLEAAAETVDGILDAPSPNAYVDEFDSDAIAVVVHYWVADPDQGDVLSIQSAYARAVQSRFETAGITLSPASKRDLQGQIGINESG